jgi:FkbM family methyltransferase
MGFANHVRQHSPRVWFFFKFLRYKYAKGERELRLVRHFVRDQRIALDIGSSIGIYARELAKHAPKVFAFEANPRVAAFARSVARRNVEIINVALSAVDGQMVLRIPINHRNNPVDDLATVEVKNSLQHDKMITINVATKRLDDYDLPSCGFIKIDVEGHEESVLDGAKRVLEVHRPILMIELDDRHNPGTIKRVTDRLSQLSYIAFFLSDSRLQPFEEFNRHDHQNIKAIKQEHRRKVEYINNFIFVPKEAVSTVISRFFGAP